MAMLVIQAASKLAHYILHVATDLAFCGTSTNTCSQSLDTYPDAVNEATGYFWRATQTSGGVNMQLR